MEVFGEFILYLWVIFFIYLFFEIFNFIKYKKWLKELYNAPFPKEAQKLLSQFPQYNRLDNHSKKILHYKILRFIKEKEFLGFGIDVDEKMKYIIAFFACLPTLAYKEFCYPSLKYIYIYPHTILKESKNFLFSQRELIAGEAAGEIVILAWDEVKKELKSNKRNVIIHEFAHELDFEQGAINGIPPVDSSFFKEWTQIMFREYEKFKKRSLKERFLGRFRFIDRYAATNEAEFFAVMSEYYFTNPDVLKKHLPLVYKELKKFYKIEI